MTCLCELSFITVSPPWNVASGDILPLQIRPPRRIFTGKISPGETFYMNLHVLIIIAFPMKKNPPTPLKILSPIKMSPLSRTLLVTEVERSSQWKNLPMIISPLLLKVVVLLKVRTTTHANSSTDTQVRSAKNCNKHSKISSTPYKQML